MTNKIKCEWCGQIYDFSVECTCPKCGGTNNNLDLNKITNSSKNINKTINKTKKNTKSFIKKPIIKWILIFLGFICIVNIISAISNSFSFSNNKSPYEYDSEGNIDLDNYDDSSNSSISKSSSYDYHNDYVNHTFYVENEDYIQTDDGGKMIVPYFSVNQYISTYVSDRFWIDFDIQVLENDYSSHKIEFYITKDGSDIRVADDENSFGYNNSDIKSLNDIYKAKTSLKFNGTCNVKEENLDKITGLKIYIDGKEYSYNVKYLKEKDISFYDIKKDYLISDKISFGDNNTLYVDSIQEIDYCRNYVSYKLNISSDINQFSKEDLRFILEDAFGYKYELFFDFSNNVNSFNDYLRSSTGTNKYVWCKTYGREVVPVKLYVLIGTEKYELAVK